MDFFKNRNKDFEAEIQEGVANLGVDKLTSLPLFVRRQGKLYILQIEMNLKNVITIQYMDLADRDKFPIKATFGLSEYKESIFEIFRDFAEGK